MADATVIGRDGLRGVVDAADGPIRRAGAVDVRLDDGRILSVPSALLEPLGDASTYFLPLAPSDLPDGPIDEGRATGERLVEGGVEGTIERIIPVVREEIEVARRRIETGRVRVTKSVQTVEQDVDATTTSERVEVHRVAVDRLVGSPEPARNEGDTIVVPVHEEILVVERRWRVREELRLIVIRDEQPRRERVALRREEVVVERIPAEAGLPATSGRADGT